MVIPASSGGSCYGYRIWRCISFLRVVTCLVMTQPYSGKDYSKIELTVDYPIVEVLFVFLFNRG